MESENRAEAAAQMSISELAAHHGLSMRTLRFYEERGLLHPMRSSHARSYTEQDQIRLQMIVVGKRFGFSLSEIGKLIGYVDRRSEADDHPVSGDFLAGLSATEIKEKIDHLQRRRDDLQKAIADLEAIRVERPCISE